MEEGPSQVAIHVQDFDDEAVSSSSFRPSSACFCDETSVEGQGEWEGKTLS